MTDPRAAASARAALSASRTLRALLLALSLGALACRRVPDFSAYREQAEAIASARRGELSQLGKRLEALRRRAAALPAQGPGATEAREWVARCELRWSGLRDAVALLAGKVSSAIKTGAPARVERTLAVAASQIDRDVVALRVELDGAASEVAAAEERRAAR